MNAQEKWLQALTRLPLVAILRGLRPEEATAVGAAARMDSPEDGLIDTKMNSAPIKIGSRRFKRRKVIEWRCFLD